jgi:tRNA(His) 5'-end guanylyltransferase
MKNDSLGDRMKMLERIGSARLIPLLPVMVRLDGKNFHNFTKGLERPYDQRLSDLMIETTRYLVEETNARIGYTQSDEITLMWMSTTYKSELFMGGKPSKIISILAAMASVYFNKKLAEYLPEKSEQSPIFDCRIWNLPTKEEVVNALIWREQDAVRNSIQMAGQSQFSHRQLQNQSCDQIQEMLFQGAGINWNDYPDFFRRGTYVRSVRHNEPFTVEEIESLPEKHDARKNPDLVIERRIVEQIKMPILTKVVNRIGVIFDGEEPVLADLK